MRTGVRSDVILSDETLLDSTLLVNRVKHVLIPQKVLHPKSHDLTSVMVHLTQPTSGIVTRGRGTYKIIRRQSREYLRLIRN